MIVGKKDVPIIALLMEYVILKPLNANVMSDGLVKVVQKMFVQMIVPVKVYAQTMAVNVMKGGKVRIAQLRFALIVVTAKESAYLVIVYVNLVTREFHVMKQYVQMIVMEMEFVKILLANVILNSQD